MTRCCVSYGCTRRVLLIGRYAVKVPDITEWRMFLRGLLANMQEVWLYKLGWPELCPVVFSIPGGFLIVMRRARVLSDDEFLDLDMKQWVQRGRYTIPAELKSNSFGYLDGRLVAIDYGN